MLNTAVPDLPRPDDVRPEADVSDEGVDSLVVVDAVVVAQQRKDGRVLDHPALGHALPGWGEHEQVLGGLGKPYWGERGLKNIPLVYVLLSEPKAPVRVFQGVGKSSSLIPMISKMAEPIWVKLSGLIKYMVESVLAKEFFKKTQI